MSRIGLNITITGLTGKLLIRWVKSSAPLAEVGRSDDFDFPYDAVYNITDLDPVVYIVQLWRSDDGIALDQLIKDWAIDASIYNETTISTYQYLVGRGTTEGTIGEGDYWLDPSNGDNELIDERLDGATQDELIVHEAGFGNKLNAEYGLVTGGGIELYGGKTFDEGTAWFITRIQTVAQQVASSTTSNMYDGVTTVTANRDFYVSALDNLYNKLVLANWAGSVGTITFLDLSLIPDDTHVTFNTHGGSQKYLKLQFDSGDTVKFFNQNVNVIYLAKCEKISLYFHSGVCHVIDYDGKFLERGTVVLDYDTSRATDSLARILADESSGELLESDLPGLYALVDSMPSGKVNLGTSIGQWSYDSGGGVYPNKRFFGIQTTAPKKIRVPHLSGLVAKIGSTPGTYQADNVGSFSGNISLPKGHGYTGGPNVARIGNGNNTPENKDVPFTYTAAITETRVKSFEQIAFIQL